MKFQIFQSQKGDCILLESADGRRILCDGGMAESMREHVRSELSKLRAKKKKIDYAYVSHIDQDHISGILQLLNDELEWRVYDFHKGSGGVKKPAIPRPPEIGGIWHNAFHTQVGKNAGPVADLLAAAAPALLATRIPKYADAGEEMYQIATSIPEAIKVSRLASPDILDIPVNKLPGAKGPAPLLMIRDDMKPVQVGSLKLQIVGPSKDELKLLRDGWNNWLRSNRTKIKEIDTELKKKIAEFSNSSAVPTAVTLRDWNGIPDFKGVTAPNIASLMFMVHEGEKTALLTGDSQQDIILKGLEQTGYLNKGYLHLNVLKMPHHASENNFDDEIASIITADHYILCGNGQNTNPDPSVIDMIYNARVGKGRTAKAPEADGRKFTLWFSTSGDGKAVAHMKKLRAKVKGLVSRSNGKMRAVFNDKSCVTLTV
ncbi:MBL fold metallo-hydrolase [Bradyrhizobium yuanmingense]|uniref:MBL fold metallo-hydrolase n=1 Tax=Bradyrhizobium yuanmingense TaxID=108015 RepID=UPI00187D24EB|nr:MBL fold metallo-hydrolase [Bradyrhizobium yuanmingense]